MAVEAAERATEAVTRMPPDGYTLLLVNSQNAINVALYEKLSFDCVRDIAQVSALLAKMPDAWWGSRQRSSLRQTKRQLPIRLLHRRSQRTTPSTQVIDPRRPGLRFRGFSRPAVFGALGQVLIIGSDIEHLLFGGRIGHALRYRARFLRTVAPVLWII